MVFCLFMTACCHELFYSWASCCSRDEWNFRNRRCSNFEAAPERVEGSLWLMLARAHACARLGDRSGTSTTNAASVTYPPPSNTFLPSQPLIFAHLMIIQSQMLVTHALFQMPLFQGLLRALFHACPSTWTANAIIQFRFVL